ncbi:MAG: transporter [Candidatus Korobacteraceae bacterium]
MNNPPAYLGRVLDGGRQSGARAGRTTLCALMLGIVCAALLVPSAAQVRGEYSPGSTLSNGGTVPDPGFSYSNQIWYNSSDRLYGPKGKLVPFHGQLSALTDNNTVVYVPKFHFLGAKMQFLIDIAISNGRFDTRNPLDGDKVIRGAVGISNTSFVPFDLGWNLKWLDFQAGVSIYAPTGRYRPHAADNLSSGFWTAGPQTGATIYLSKNKLTQASVFAYYGWNRIQHDTDIHPGANASVDYALSHTFQLSSDGKWSLLAGPAGYGQWQTTNKGGVRKDNARLLYGVDGVGFTTNLTTPYKGLYAGFSALFEYDARNTYEGRTNVISAGLSF